VRKLLLNFADRHFSQAQRANSKTGLKVAGFDEVAACGPRDIAADFFARNERILREPRGAGCWLWKPYLMARALERLKDGDYLFYSDAGAEFIRPIEPLIALCEKHGQDVLVFELAGLEKHWTKRDAFLVMGCDSPPYTDTRQRMGTFILCRRSPFSRGFIGEFLRYAQDERLITDAPNQLGQPDYDGFIQHRHDQSLLSLLSKRHGLQAHRDPSQWGNEMRDLYPESRYEQLIDHTRVRNAPHSEGGVIRRLKRLKRSALRWLGGVVRRGRA